MTPEELAPHFASWGSNVDVGSNVRFIHPEKIHVGDNVSIQDMAYLDATYGKEIRLENNCRIARFSQLICSGFGFDDGFIWLKQGSRTGLFNVLNGHAGLTIGENVMIAPQCSLNGFKHTFDRVDIPMNAQPEIANPITIEDDVYIATGALVMGVRIGHGSVIGAHALVTRDVPPYSIVMGVPGRVVGNRLDKSRHAQLLADNAAE